MSRTEVFLSIIIEKELPGQANRVNRITELYLSNWEKRKLVRTLAV